MDNIKLSGNWTCIHRNKNNKILKIVNQDNCILNVGKTQVAKLIGGISTNFFTTIAIGTGTSTSGPTETDVGLYNEVSAYASTRSYVSDYKCQFYYRFTFSSSTIITEAGIKRSGIFLNHTMFDTPFSLVSGDYLDVYCIITVS